MSTVWTTPTSTAWTHYIAYSFKCKFFSYNYSKEFTYQCSNVVSGVSSLDISFLETASHNSTSPRKFPNPPNKRSSQVKVNTSLQKAFFMLLFTYKY